MRGSTARVGPVRAARGGPARQICGYRQFPLQGERAARDARL